MVDGATPVVPVWRNELGGLTFRIGDDRYLKWAPTESGITFADEIARLQWASAYIVVPRVLDAGATDDGEWLLTAAIPGENAVSERWKREPRTAARAIGAGLRAMHDMLPVLECPFDWSIAERRKRLTDPAAPLPAEPPNDQLVVCHGDPCAPNTLLDDNGGVAGHVDLGRLGVADLWADLAVATYNLGRNYGDGFERDLLDAYGIDPDEERTAFYRALWDAT
ncbi:MAG: kanamycin kinase [Frankiaceae bacterium]|nr:kanamycin kinase [Frankiaceae bacterium]